MDKAKGGQVKYVALLYGDEASWETRSDDERAAIRSRYTRLVEDMQSAGVIAGGDELASTRDATTVRVRDAETLVVDGPYAEVKEALGGYFLLECESMAEALDWASRIPAAEHGAIEVRPVYVDPEEVQL
jgi:hypothetical protein